MANVMVQPTPNPNSMKFMLDRPVVATGSESYMNAEAAEKSPLASALFKLDGVASIFMLGNFITVNKAGDAAWEDLVPRIEQVITQELG